jgi:hypothetical protein
MKKLFALLTVVLFSGFMMAQNTAKVTENGNYNEATVTQTGSNYVELDQLNGDYNEGTVTQNGSNEAYLVQGMTEGYYAIYGVTTTNMISNDNAGTLNQDGNGNYIDFLQVGNLNSGEISQVGDNNEGYAYLGWAGDWWGFGGVLASLYSNESKVDISQNGDNNFGAVWQYGGINNEVNIAQDGNFNVASIAQGFIYDDFAYDFTTPVYNTQFNYAEVNQYGNDNIGKAFQLGNSNSFTLTQNGNGNKVGAYIGPDDLLLRRNAYFAQDGNNNIFVGEQNDGATLDNTSFQFGDNNAIDLLQGTGDIALIQQTGDFNTANVYQYGVGQDASVVQTGNSNTATVTQQ